MNDHEMKRLMDSMHAAAGAVVESHKCMNDPDYIADPEVLALAKKCYEDGALDLARTYTTFINEIIDRRHATGNFQYPFEEH